MKESKENTSAGYRIGAVARLTGISADTLRVWERRYALVSPSRSAGGGRLYSPQDVERLRLVKQLVDAGESIGSLANLGSDQLTERARAYTGSPAVAAGGADCRVVVVGEALSTRLHSAAAGELEGIELVAGFNDADAALRADPVDASDVLIIELATLQTGSAASVVSLMSRVGAAAAVVVYRFASQQALSGLPRRRCSALRAPVDLATLRSRCRDLCGHARGDIAGAQTQRPVDLSPPRRYSDAALARIATLSTTVKCECPRHLAELITSLSAFEQYSMECESRGARDAALHAHLNATAAQARHLIETALGEVLKAEKIQLD